jgi:hypothetical protein
MHKRLMGRHKCEYSMDGTQPVESICHSKKLLTMKMKLFVKLGFVTLATWAFLEGALPVKAGQPDWVRTERIQFLKALGNVLPGFRSHNGNQMPASKVEQESAVQASQLPKADENWLDIYKSLSFLGGA